VLQHWCCSVLQCVAVCCSVFDPGCVACAPLVVSECWNNDLHDWQYTPFRCDVLQHCHTGVTVRGNVLLCVAMYWDKDPRCMCVTCIIHRYAVTRCSTRIPRALHLNGLAAGFANNEKEDCDRDDAKPAWYVICIYTYRSNYMYKDIERRARGCRARARVRAHVRVCARARSVW